MGDLRGLHHGLQLLGSQPGVRVPLQAVRQQAPPLQVLRRRSLTEVRQALRGAYVERGYEAVRVEFELRDTDDPTRKALVVRILEGQPTRIVGIEYEGTPPPRAARVRRALGFSAGAGQNTEPET